MQRIKLQVTRPSLRGRGLFLLGLVLLALSPAWVAADSAFPQGDASAPESVYPSQVILASFVANSVDGGIVVEWNTEIEQFNSGFNLYRSMHGANQFVQVNDGLIPSQVQQGPGSATYDLMDASVAVGTAYDYWLESIDFQALPTFHGLITVEAVVNQPPQMDHRIFLPFVANQ